MDAVKEVGSIEQIRHARVRDIIGPDSIFVGQSGTYPRTFSDYREEDTKALRKKTREDVEQALPIELGVAVAAARMALLSNAATFARHSPAGRGSVRRRS